MTKISSSIIILFALFALVSTEQFQRLNFDQGRLRFRSLDTTPSLKSFDFQKTYAPNSAVSVTLGNGYPAKANLDPTKPTDMMLFLYSSTTGFCPNCDKFEKFNCDAITCAYDNETPQQTFGPHYYITKGYPFAFKVNIGSDSSSWSLKTALYYSNSDLKTEWVRGSSGSTLNYFQNSDTYGFIGLGVDGDSAKNFAGSHPIFSIKVNTAGDGQLIFGKDTTLYDSSLQSITVPTNNNWTMTAKQVAIGSDSTLLTSSANLIFDLQYAALGLPDADYKTILEKMKTTYKITDDVTGRDGFYKYSHQGSLSGLPNIVISVNNDLSVTIPPSAYTRKLAENLYAILIAPVNSVAGEGGVQINYIIFGWPVLSQFYTVFEQVDSKATVTLYPTYAGAPKTPTDTTTPTNPTNPSTPTDTTTPTKDTTTPNTDTTTTTPASSSTWRIIIIVVVIVLIAIIVLSLAFRRKSNVTKSDLGVELRAARV